MDPQAAWEQLLAAFATGDWNQIEESASAILAWLDHDGFPPTVTGEPNLGPEWERALAQAGCRFALDTVRNRWTIKT